VLAYLVLAYLGLAYLVLARRLPSGADVRCD
jgi:hypothetical protein